MQHFEIAMGLIRQGDRYALQLRNGSSQSGALNLIGCFGGQVEPNETAEQAVCREVSEESNLKPEVQDLTYVGQVKVLSERHDKPITVSAAIYLIDVASNVKIIAREGKLIYMADMEIRNSLDKLTPATRACFEQLIKE